MKNLDIIYEHNDYIVVNKQAGLISEKSQFEDCTAESQVLYHLSKSHKKPYVGVIHRLDRVTSGVIIFAKNKRTLVQYNDLFSSRTIQKTYLAIVHSQPSKPSATLTNFLVKNNLSKRADIVPSKSKESVDSKLSYIVISKNDIGYLLEVKPTTGRFHQIRAQLSHIGLPIIGDDKYGSDQAYLPLSIGLHAWKIAYQDPKTKEQKTFEAPLPNNDFWKFESQ